MNSMKHAHRGIVAAGAATLLMVMSSMLAACDDVAPMASAQTTATTVPRGVAYIVDEFDSVQASLPPDPAPQPQAF